MTSRTISAQNIQSHIESFSNDFNNQKAKFSELEDRIMQLKLNLQNRRSEWRQTLGDIQSDLLRNLKMNCQLSEDELPDELYEEKLTRFDTVLVFSENKIISLNDNLSKMETEVNEKYEKVVSLGAEIKESVSPDHFSKPSKKQNLFILNSRQTEEAFVVLNMKPGSRFQCSGCKQNIPLQSFYLSHIEEYPSGSKTFIPHSYHMSRECLYQRGFDSEYLYRIDVKCAVEINKDIITILKEIGFDNSHLIDAQKYNMDSDEGNDSDDIPDNVSEMSDISSVASIASSNCQKLVFLYNRKPLTQKKVIICQGCKSPINTETYISLQEKSDVKPFHVKKICLLDGDALPDQLSNTTVKVFRLLKTHNELRELLACGFYYNKIIGFRPPNPNVKQIPTKQNKNLPNKRPLTNQQISNVAFIFNEESFIYEKLAHAERCRGCQQQIKKDEISLRHKERVPRDKLEYSPLISQFYHAKRECLLSRGFTIKYISFAKCIAMLSGDENLSRVTDILIKCGFCNENICYSPKESNETRKFESNIKQPDKVEKEFKFYIDNCVKSNAHCEGCGFVLMPNQPCFVYALKNSQDSTATMFHIRSSCLKANFSKEQLMSITCVNNDSIDVSPNDIINCGLTKIVTENKYFVDTKPKNINEFPTRNCPKKPFIFDVDIVTDDRIRCFTCRQFLVLDKYVLKIKDREPDKSQIHLNPDCVKKLGLPPAELSGCKLSFNVFVSIDGLMKLRECGFKRIPNN